MKYRTLPIITILLFSVILIPSAQATSFPVVELANGFGRQGTHFPVNMPILSGGISEGDLLLVVICKATTDTLTDTPQFPVGTDIPGWSLLADQSGGGANPRIRIWGKLANSSELSNYSMTSSSSELVIYQSFRVAGHFGTLTSTTISIITSISADPPNNNPTGWDIENTLWLTGLCMNDAPGPVQATSGPTGYTLLRNDFNATITTRSQTSAFIKNATAAENPGQFTLDMTPDSTVSYTLAVRPQSDPPLVTLPATLISYNRATLNGRLDFLFSATVDLSFEWGETPSLGNDTASIIVSSTGQYSIILSNLESNTTYYFRAHSLEIPGGYESFGSILNFTTTETPFVVTHLVNGLYIIGFLTVVVLFFLLIFWVRRRREGVL